MSRQLVPTFFIPTPIIAPREGSQQRMSKKGEGGMSFPKTPSVSPNPSPSAGLEHTFDDTVWFWHDVQFDSMPAIFLLVAIFKAGELVLYTWCMRCGSKWWNLCRQSGSAMRLKFRTTNPPLRGRQPPLRARSWRPPAQRSPRRLMNFSCPGCSASPTLSIPLFLRYD